MPLAVPETIGFCEEVIQFMTTNSASLNSKGLAVANLITDLTAFKSTLVTANDTQEAAKADLRVKTFIATAAQKTAYTQASTNLDAVIGTLGRTTEAGKQAARIRSALRRSARSGANGSSASTRA